MVRNGKQNETKRVNQTKINSQNGFFFGLIYFVNETTCDIEAVIHFFSGELLTVYWAWHFHDECVFMLLRLYVSIYVSRAISPKNKESSTRVQNHIHLNFLGEQMDARHIYSLERLFNGNTQMKCCFAGFV